MQTSSFASLGLSEPIVKAVTNEGYTTPTPIQAQAIPHVLAGRDVLGCAQTGTGKTAAFALPILHRLAAEPGRKPAGKGRRPSKPIRALILSPTRELALQIEESFKTYGRGSGLSGCCIFGGVGQNPQVRALQHGVDIVIATPGRLLDLMNQGYVDLSCVDVFVLDEADRMLDMGFIHDIRRIIAKLPSTSAHARQTLLFSATMPKEIRSLADTLLKDPVSVTVAPVSSTAEKIEQSVYFVDKPNKPEMLVHFMNTEHPERVLVFTRTKHGADRVERHLNRAGIPAEAIHGNKRQNARVRTMENFRSGRTAVLVATDIAARGIDIDDITHVVNYDLPNEPETYVHRIGRTGRAGNAGIAVSFCDREERSFLKAIERLTRVQLTVMRDMPVFEPVAPRPHTPRTDAHRTDGHRADGHRSEGPRGAHRGAHASAHPHAHPRAHAGGHAPAHGSSHGSSHGHSRPSASGKPAHHGPKPHAGKPGAHAPAKAGPRPHAQPRAAGAGAGAGTGAGTSAHHAGKPGHKPGGKPPVRSARGPRGGPRRGSGPRF